MPVIKPTEYWESRDNWDIAVKNPSRAMMKLLLKHLPEEVCEYIEKENLTILDWGGSQGQGTEEISKRFPTAKVTGCDLSVSTVDSLKDHFEAIIGNNSLQYFSDPLEKVLHLLPYTGKYYIALVPYAEKPPLAQGHRSTFDLSTFPIELDNFILISLQILELRKKGLGNGEQMIIVYKRN